MLTLELNSIFPYRLDSYHEIFKLFARNKIAGKGFPSDCLTDEEKDAFTQSLRDETGLNITTDIISDNPAMVICAKLLLNASIGKHVRIILYFEGVNFYLSCYLSSVSSRLSRMLENHKVAPILLRLIFHVVYPLYLLEKF